MEVTHGNDDSDQLSHWHSDQSLLAKGIMRKLGLLLSGIAVLSVIGCSGGGDVSPEQEAALRKKLSGPPTIPGHEVHNGPGGGARMKEKQAQAGAQAPASGQ